LPVHAIVGQTALGPTPAAHRLRSYSPTGSRLGASA
jgi:hypothetical protein